MSESLFLELLRAIRGDISALHSEILELKHRVSAVEIGLAAVRRDIAGSFESNAASSLRTDSLEERVSRIERRLELIDHS